MAFHEAAVRCAEEVPIPGCEKPVPALHSPGVACTAFAAELYMKSLVLRRGDRPHGHELDSLYADLESDERDAIAKQYRRIRGAGIPRLLREIRAVAKAFTEWRYSYEAPRNIDYGALQAFTTSAYRAVRELALEWPVGEPVHSRLDSWETPIIYVGTGPQSEASLRIQFMSVEAERRRPQPEIIKRQQNDLSISAPVLSLEGQTVTVSTKRGGDANPKGGRSRTR